MCLHVGVGEEYSNLKPAGWPCSIWNMALISRCLVAFPSADNSGLVPNVLSSPVLVPGQPMKLKIGVTTIRISASDLSGNRAKCVFRVTVKGELDSKYTPKIGIMMDQQLRSVHGIHMQMICDQRTS